MKVLAITQARVGSSRLPSKVLLAVGNDSLLGLHLKRLNRSKLIDKLLVATTHEQGSEKIIAIAEENGVDTFKGNMNDVLDRYYQAALPYNPEFVVRVTSDCPLIDAELLDEVVDKMINSNCDYLSNALSEEFPDGQDVEVFKFSALKEAWEKATKPSEREHVTSYIRTHSNLNGETDFSVEEFKAPRNYGKLRMTVDEPKDLEIIRWLVNELGTEMRWEQYAKFMLEHQDKLINKNITRNEGYLKSIKKEK